MPDTKGEIAMLEKEYAELVHYLKGMIADGQFSLFMVGIFSTGKTPPLSIC